MRRMAQLPLHHGSDDLAGHLLPGRSSLTIASLQMFDKVYVLFGQSGKRTYAGNASLFYSMYLFQQAFQSAADGLRLGAGLAAVAHHLIHHCHPGEGR